MGGDIRVLFVIPAFAAGGGEMLVRNLALEGLGEGFDVAICSIAASTDTFLEEDLRIKGVKVHCLGRGGRRLSPCSVWPLYRLLKEFSPHVVHSHLNALFFVLPASAMARVPVRIHTVHNTAQFEGSWLLRVFSRVAFKFLGFTAVGISETIGVTVREYYGLDDVPIINNGISTREYAFCQESREAKRKELGLRDGTFACVHVGNFRIQKNHKLLVRAFAKALENKIDMVLLLIGDGRLRHETEVLIRELRVEDRIRLLGTRGDVASILSASDLFVFSSDWEGLPLSVTEAMAAGLPVVSTDAGGVVDLVKDGETGYIARRGDEDNLAAAILRAASDLEVARSLGKAAAAAVRDNFDISQAVSGHATLYKKLLKQAGGGDI